MDTTDVPSSNGDSLLTPMTRSSTKRDIETDSSPEVESGHFVRQPVKIHLVPRRRLVR